MTTRDAVVLEIEHVPEPLLREVLDFVRYLKNKLAQEGLDTTKVSEQVLAKDWNRPEEDRAWGQL